MRALLVTPAIALLGCALALQPNDSAPEKAAKVTTRALLVLPTLGISEFVIYHETYKRERDAYLEDLFNAQREALHRLRTAETDVEVQRTTVELEMIESEIQRMTAIATDSSTICIPIGEPENPGIYCR